MERNCNETAMVISGQVPDSTLADSGDFHITSFWSYDI